MTADVGFETYRYEQDAPIDDTVVSPWPTLAFDSRRRGYSPDAWMASWTDADVFANAGQTNAIQPAFVDGTAYFGGKLPSYQGIGSSNGPSGIRSVDGDQYGWSVQEKGALATPTVVGNAIFVTSNGMSRALDRRDGTLCWAYHKGRSNPTASPTVVDGTVYVVGQRVFALAARTGEVEWTTEHLDFSPQGTAVTDNAVFATAGGDGGGAVYRFDPETGQQDWRASTSSSIRVPPVLGERVYVLDADGRLRALRRSDGSEAWSHQFGGRSSALPAVAQGTVYAATTNGTTLKAFDELTGAVRWEFEFDGRRAMGPTVARDIVYLPITDDDGGRIDALQSESGSLLISHDLPHSPASSLVIGEGVGLITADPSRSSTLLYVLTQTET